MIVIIVGLVISLATLLLLLWQTRLMRRSLGAETLMHLDDVWRSERKMKTRAAGATALLQGRSKRKTARELYESDQSDIDEVLDYLETVSFLCSTRVLDRELAWNMFYWPMENYWLASRDYIDFVRGKEGRQTWDKITEELPKLRKWNRGEPPPGDEQIELFLRTEAALCEEESAGASVGS